VAVNERWFRVGRVAGVRWRLQEAARAHGDGEPQDTSHLLCVGDSESRRDSSAVTTQHGSTNGRRPTAPLST